MSDRRSAVLVALVLLSGCKDEKKAAPAAASAAPVDRIREATEQNLRSGMPPQMRFRGMQVYAQAMPQKMAVCGQLDPFADDPNIFVPFVSIVTVPLTTDAQTQYQFENHVATTTSEASRVYVALVNYCYEKGGPTPGPYRTVMPTPPLPDSVPDPGGKSKLTLTVRGMPTATPVTPGTPPPAAVVAVAPPAPTGPVSDQTPAAGTAIMRQAGNLHSDPKGPSIRVVPQGTPMHVFAQAPGGWYQVGDTAPWGWIHESMLDRH